MLGVSIPFRPLFYGHVVLLHLSLLFRVGGDLALVEPLRRAGAWGNAAAILLFLGTTLYSAATAPGTPGTSPDDTRAPGPRSSGHEQETIPDLELPGDE